MEGYRLEDVIDTHIHLSQHYSGGLPNTWHPKVGLDKSMKHSAFAPRPCLSSSMTLHASRRQKTFYKPVITPHRPV